ncbi:MAG TPA: DMT family transporter [Bacteroidota bacterium]|jgi:drug/metabolite transporter (DMT)-like permease
MQFLGEISALLTACLWSGSSLSFAAATKRVGSVKVNITRLLLAALALLAIVLIAGLAAPLSNNQLAYLAVSGVIGFAIGDTFLFMAFQRLGARISMLVMSLAPAVAAILAFLMLGEGVSTVGAIGITLTMVGICIVILERSELDGEAPRFHFTSAGIALALVAAAGQGSGLVFAKMAFREGHVNGVLATLVRVLASLVILLPVTLIAGKYKAPVETFRRDSKAFVLTAAGALFGPVFGVICSLVAIQYTTVGIAATLMATTPILMLPLVRMVHKEHLGWRAFTGSFVAVAGVAVLFLR